MCEVHKGNVSDQEILDSLESGFQEEKRKTAECLADVRQFLSHDTSPTRRQLARVLHERAFMIETEVSLERKVNMIIGG